MSKQPVAPQAGGEPPSHARATNAAPSRGAAAAQPPIRHRNASVQSERQTVAGAPRDGARRTEVRLMAVHGDEALRGGGQHTGEGPQDATQGKRPKPSYVPPSQKRGQRPADEQIPSHQGSVPEGRPGASPRGSSPPATAPPLERIPIEGVSRREAPPAKYGRLSNGGKRQPMAFCFTLCCILFWLLVIAVGVAVLVVYLIYRPQPPRLRVTSATLNVGYIDELGAGGMALNSDLTVLAAISNPNTVIHIVLYYMQLDLYFRGSLIGTQVVWPAPLYEGPGYSVLRNVHLVMSEVTMTREDAMAWQNATAKGGPVTLHLYGRFHTQLNFGRWLPFKYWVNPRCTLWLDPPPSGALRRARC